jgi:hypothetical protein
MNAFRTLLAACLLATGLAGTALAHHSYQMFDRDKRVTYQGTVTRVEWTNPHIWIFATVEDPKTKKKVEWGFEAGGGTAGATRQGWKKSHFAPGTAVTVLANPLRNGEPGAGIVKVTLADGSVFGEGGKGPGVAVTP